ncbi:alpha/beta hydrolase [Sphingomonas sp. PB2P19]|uniref:alpha/beta hydrolase n=1 Tax=Sphingomonas rhamnosi TaxID=3096156 RepID=UPI002FC727EC
MGTVFDDAPQHGPRPLPLFLTLLQAETAADADRTTRALAGLNAYQDAVREPPMPAMPVAAQVGRVTLRDYGGTGRPVVFVPSLINPPGILDLSAETSLLRWIATQGMRAFLVDWGTPTAQDRDLDLADHVDRLLVPLLAGLATPPVLVGYCLGGTLAIAAAASMPVAAVATIAAPWHFAGYGEPARAALAAMWTAVEPAASALGLLPIEVLQTAFWQLDPGRTIAKYETFARMPADSPAARAFVRLEDWANTGAPLPYAAARTLFADCIATDRPGRGAWLIGDTIVDPLRLECPTVEFVSLTDRIVPAATAIGFADRRDLALGHVGMIVGGRARTALWDPLVAWIGGLSPHRIA